MPIHLFQKTFQDIRNIARLRQVLAVLAQYGFGWAVDKLKLEPRIFHRPTTNKQKEEQLKQMSIAQRLRMVMEELGTTFIKLGQVLSLRPDLVGHEFASEFEQLQSDVMPFPFEQIKEIIEEELKKPLKDIFFIFDKESISAASIAQVHRAVLYSGEEVIVKVQRPKLKKLVTTDLSIIKGLAKLAVQLDIIEEQLYHPIDIVEELEKALIKELDFNIEGRSADRFASNFAKDKSVYIPKTYWKYTTDKVLTQEYLQGVKINQIDTLPEGQVDKKLIARNGVRLLLRQVFIFGFFHADPHPGNLYVLDNNIIGLIDFGMVGRLSGHTKEAIADMFIGILTRDIDKIIRVFIDLDAIDEDVDRRALYNDLLDFIDRYYQIPLNQLHIGLIISEIWQNVAHHRIRVLPELTLLAKALITIEGVGRSLDPDLDMISESMPYAKEILLNKYNPRRFIKATWETIYDTTRLIRILPEELRLVLRKTRLGNLKIELQHLGLEDLIKQLERSSNRISASMIIAALIVGSSIIMVTGVKYSFKGLPILGILGYIVAALLGFWLVIAMLRGGGKF